MRNRLGGRRFYFYIHFSLTMLYVNLYSDSTGILQRRNEFRCQDFLFTFILFFASLCLQRKMRKILNHFVRFYFIFVSPCASCIGKQIFVTLNIILFCFFEWISNLVTEVVFFFMECQEYFIRLTFFSDKMVI